jgi:hypothetical protein
MLGNHGPGSGFCFVHRSLGERAELAVRQSQPTKCRLAVSAGARPRSLDQEAVSE